MEEVLARIACTACKQAILLLQGTDSRTVFFGTNHKPLLALVLQCFDSNWHCSLANGKSIRLVKLI